MFSISNLIISSGFQKQLQYRVDFKKITIFVGPNNSGKSTILMDIERWFNEKYPKMKLIKNIEISLSGNPDDYAEFEKDILQFEDGERLGPEGESIPLIKQHLLTEIRDGPNWYSLGAIKNEFDRNNIEYFRRPFFRFFVARLDGKSRFDLSESKHYHLWRTSRTPFNYLSRLYLNVDDQTKLGRIVNEEFGRYTYLKKDDNNYIHILLSKFPKNEIAGLTEDTPADSLEEITITEFGDGVKCFVGLCMSILACPFRVVLIDEPEAFLHPPTAYSLGRNLSLWTKEKRRSLVISTHSSDFLMGCLQCTPYSDISIVRLTYQNDIGTVKQLPEDEILYYARDPLLRSSDVLNAFFYNSAIVTEGGDDKVIYQEGNNKLLQYKRGISNTIFLSANGKDVVRRIIRPLRKIGVPAAAIYDFDVVRHKNVETEEKTLWRAILSSSNVESSKFDCLEKDRQYIEFEIRKLNKRKGRNEEKGYFKKLASDEIGEELSKRILELLNELKGYGIFIVPIGEVENWLREVPDTHEEVLINILNKIDKTTPTGFDIWRFIDEINTWISNPNRKGMFANSTANSVKASKK